MLHCRFALCTGVSRAVLGVVQGSNPGPLVELDFWRTKAENLNSIYDQLQGEKVQKVKPTCTFRYPIRMSLLYTPGAALGCNSQAFVTDHLKVERLRWHAC